MSTLSQSLSTGSTQVNKKLKQSTVAECEGVAALELAQQAVAGMWYRAAIPFCAVAYPDVVDAFDAVCEYGSRTGSASFPLPTVPSLRNSRLDQEVKRIEKELECHHKSVQKFGLSLQSDGKDSMSRRHLVNILTTTPLGPQFREVVDVSGQSRDAEHTAQVLMDAFMRLPADDQKNLVTVITDTPAVNRKAWTILEDKMPHVQCVPCAAHCINLHFKHIAKGLPEFNDMVEQCKLVVRRLYAPHFA